MDSAGLDEDLRGTFLFNGGIDCHFYTTTSLYHMPLLWPLSASLPRGQFLTLQCKSQALATRRTQTGKRLPSRSTRPETFLLGLQVKEPGLCHRKYEKCLEHCLQQICLQESPNASLQILCMHASICKGKAQVLSASRTSPSNSCHRSISSVYKLAGGKKRVWTRWTNRMLIAYPAENTKTVLYLEQRLPERRDHVCLTHNAESRRCSWLGDEGLERWMNMQSLSCHQ